MSDNGIILPSIIHLNLMRGVLPKKDDTKDIDEKFKDEDSKNLAFRILEQDRQIILKTKEDFDTYNEMNKNFDKCLLSLRDAINTISLSVKKTQSKNDFDLDEGVVFKINEFERLTKENNDKIKKLNETIPENTRKRKENDDFFKKFIGEKKVWLDRLNEEELQDDMYSKTGFKYLYEAKTIKLLLEGILLEKVQERIEKVLCEKGTSFGWEVMDIESFNQKRKEDEFELNKHLLELPIEQAEREEREKKSEWEEKDRKNQTERENIQETWKKLWAEIWLPEVQLSTDNNIIQQRELYKKVTMDVIFEMFVKICFDVWKFKNLIYNNEEYIVVDKVRKYFPEYHNDRSRDENILNTMMNMIESIKQEEEIIYCDLGPAKKTLMEYKSRSKKTEAIDRLEKIISKIEKVQMELNADSTKLVRPQIEEITKLIKLIPDDKEKKLFVDNLKDDNRLYNRFLPLTNILMVVLFISIGQKRDKNYLKKIDSATEEINSLKQKNQEMNGKLQLLKEVKEKIGNENENENKNKNDQINLDDINFIDNNNENNNVYERNFKAVADAKVSLNKIIMLKNQLEKSKYNYYKEIKNKLIKPKDLLNNK
jgi:hypothetical protein